MSGDPINAVVVIYDLASFSAFLNTPNVQGYIAPYLDEITDVISGRISGIDYHGLIKKQLHPIAQPIHRKFLGDGELLLWDLVELRKNSDFDIVEDILNRFWNVQSQFENITSYIFDKIPFLSLPPRIRFGVARGSVYPIARANEIEYVGVCIDLASRLQKYCPSLSFLSSIYVDADPQLLRKHSYQRVIAKSIRGFPPEVVLVDTDEFESLETTERKNLFDEFPLKKSK